MEIIIVFGVLSLACYFINNGISLIMKLMLILSVVGAVVFTLATIGGMFLYPEETIQMVQMFQSYLPKLKEPNYSIWWL
jgi:hypothetical protein